MLVLTRRANQSIVIGGEVTVTVLEIRGDQVRIGIDAPKQVAVHRQEVWVELARANQEAASPSPAALDALRDLVPEAPAEGDAEGGPATP